MTATTIKERPILFSAPMVKAILAGLKTQTRRLVKDALPWAERFERAPFKGYGVAPQWIQMTADESRQAGAGVCRQGAAGDRLWVKETHYASGIAVDQGMGRVRYRADDLVRSPDGEFSPAVAHPPKWRPSIFMSRWMSRITLEIESVRAERLQDISEADAMAEGVIKQIVTVGRAHGRPDYNMFALTAGDHCDWECDARTVYRKLWESINGAGSWEANPWVWVVTFRRL